VLIVQPLLIWHPGQLLIGSYLAGELSIWADGMEKQDLVADTATEADLQLELENNTPASSSL
jgi:hypothetical protein